MASSNDAQPRVRADALRQAGFGLHFILAQTLPASARRSTQTLSLMEVTIAPASDEEVRSGYVGRQLREFNYRFVGEYPEVQAIRLNARDSAGRVVGGLRAIVAMHWLRIEVLWVHEELRCNGIGSRMLVEAEEIGVGLGARNAAIETFEWQAPGFYEKHGYTEAARLEKYMGDFYLATMKKSL